MICIDVTQVLSPLFHNSRKSCLSFFFFASLPSGSGGIVPVQCKARDNYGTAPQVHTAFSYPALFRKTERDFLCLTSTLALRFSTEKTLRLIHGQIIIIIMRWPVRVVWKSDYLNQWFLKCEPRNPRGHYFERELPFCTKFNVKGFIGIV